MPLNTAPKDAMGLNLNNANSRESGDGASSYSGVLDSEKKFDCISSQGQKSLSSSNNPELAAAFALGEYFVDDGEFFGFDGKYGFWWLYNNVAV